MTRKKLDFRADAYRHVLGFVFHHWTHRPLLVGGIIVLVILSTLAEVMVPVFSGQIVDAIAGGNAADGALRAFVIVVALGLTSVALRWFIFSDAGQVAAGSGLSCTRGRDNTEVEDPCGWRFSAGIGLSWQSPMGPLQLSYARPLNSKQGDDKQSFQFQIGTGF